MDFNSEVGMTQLQIDYWSMMLSAISTFMLIAAAIAGAIRYFQERERDRKERQEELSWRKTQFILELAEDFEKDEQHQFAWKLLTYQTGLPSNSTLKKMLGKDVRSLSQEEMKVRCAIDNYLDFFDRLYHFTFVTKTLNVADIEVFGWYIAQIAETKETCDYANSAGFEDVLQLNAELRELFGKRHWYQTVSKSGVDSDETNVEPVRKARRNGRNRSTGLISP